MIYKGWQLQPFFIFKIEIDNKTDWIFGAIRRVLNLYKQFDLDVAIVSYRSPDPSVRQVVDRYK
jgi:hypothetical protein